MKKTVLVVEPDDTVLSRKLADVFKAVGETVWEWQSGGGFALDGNYKHRNSCADLKQIIRVDLVFAHGTHLDGDIGREEVVPCLPQQVGKVVRYSSEDGFEESDLDRQVWWVSNRGITLEKPLEPEEARGLLNFSVGGDLPAILRPRPRRDALLRLATACQGFLASWAASHSDEVNKFREPLTRMGWFDLMNVIGQPRPAQGEGVNELVDLGHLAGRFDEVKKARWWQTLLGSTGRAEAAAIATLKTRVLADLQSHDADKVTDLLGTLANGKNVEVRVEHVADAYLQIATALEKPE